MDGEVATKVCLECKADLPLSAFRSKGVGRREYRCGPCDRAHRRARKVDAPMLPRLPSQPALGQAIRQELLRRGWSQRQLAEWVRVAPRTVEYWSAGRSCPHASTRKRLREFLAGGGMKASEATRPLDWLLRGVGPELSPDAG